MHFQVARRRVLKHTNTWYPVSSVELRMNRRLSNSQQFSIVEWFCFSCRSSTVCFVDQNCDISVTPFSPVAAESIHTTQNKFTPAPSPPLPLSLGSNWQHADAWVIVMAAGKTQILWAFPHQMHGEGPGNADTYVTQKNLDVSNKPRLAADGLTSCWRHINHVQAMCEQKPKGRPSVTSTLGAACV